MRTPGIVVLFVIITAIAALAQNQPLLWTQRTQADVNKMLNDSAWGQTQVETNTSEMTYSPTTASSGRSSTTPNPATMRAEQSQINNNRAQEGAYNKAVSINYHVRFLSAKPIREAIAQNVILREQKLGNETRIIELRTELQPFVDRDFDGYIAIAVSYDADDGRLSGKAFQDFNSAVLATLKNKTYLERDDGKRAYLLDYRAPIEDGIGARFVFARVMDDKPFITKGTKQVRFYSEVGPNVTLNRRFKVSDMFYQGKLEY